MAEERASGRRRPWLHAWLVIALAAWAQIGVLLVGWAQRRGLVENISFSPYHLVGYAALLTLAVYVAWAFFRALRRGDWRGAFPSMYGGLALAFALLAAWVVLDIAWRSTLGIHPGIEEGLSPPRLLIPIALALLASGPLREAIADRIRPGLKPGELLIRWAGVVGAGLIGGALLLLPFNPIGDALNDYRVNPGVDDTEIWTMASDGSGQSRLLMAFGDGVDYSLPAWSPDGNRLAYTTWTNDSGAAQNLRYQDQRAEIWTMAIDGSDRRLVFDNKLASTAGNLQSWIPAWSPDGTWIAFTVSPVSATSSAPARPQENMAPGQVGAPTQVEGASIWIVHPDGSAGHKVNANGTTALSLVWSPTGAGRLAGDQGDIAFIVDTGNGTTDLHVASLLGLGGPATLINDRIVAADPGANDWGPSWSPDGTKLAFTSNRSGNDEVWVAAIDGSSLVQLTDDGAGDWAPAFSPDGAQIAFVSDRSGDPEVWLMNSDGSEPRNLTYRPRASDGQWSVAWSPDGTRIAYATAQFLDASSSGWVREDLASAGAILFGIWLAIVALLIVALGAPLGSFTLAMTLIALLGTFVTQSWSFVPWLMGAGLVTDLLVRSIRLPHRARAAAAALPALANLGIGFAIGVGGSLAWTLTLLFGVTVLSAVLGWALAAAAERLLPRAMEPSEALAG